MGEKGKVFEERLRLFSLKREFQGISMRFKLTESAQDYVTAAAERITREGGNPVLAVWAERVYS
ncbi:MAG: hypothetical protein QXZ06_04805 [Candidatus Jordarchaeales archaeon]